MQDILQKIRAMTMTNLNNAVKKSRATALGLTHISYDTYRDKDYKYYVWNDQKNDFVKTGTDKKSESKDNKFDKFARLNALFAKDIG